MENPQLRRGDREKVIIYLSPCVPVTSTSFPGTPALCNRIQVWKRIRNTWNRLEMRLFFSSHLQHNIVALNKLGFVNFCARREIIRLWCFHLSFLFVMQSSGSLKQLRHREKAFGQISEGRVRAWLTSVVCYLVT